MNKASHVRSTRLKRFSHPDQTLALNPSSVRTSTTALRAARRPARSPPTTQLSRRRPSRHGRSFHQRPDPTSSQRGRG